MTDSDITEIHAIRPEETKVYLSSRRFPWNLIIGKEIRYNTLTQRTTTVDKIHAHQTDIR